MKQYYAARSILAYNVGAAVKHSHSSTLMSFLLELDGLFLDTSFVLPMRLARCFTLNQ